MAIKLNQNTNKYDVSFSKRHPVTGMPFSLKRTNIKNMSEAKRVFNELVIQLENKIKAKIIPNWEVFLESYSQSLNVQDLREKTKYTRTVVLKKHTLPDWNDKLIDEITTTEILNLLHLKFSEHSEAHKKFFIKCIRSVFNYAFECGHINRNPTPLLKFKANDKIRSVLNEEQIKILLRKAQEVSWEWYPHYALAVYTGMRNGELYALTWDKVDIEKRLIRVDLSWSDKDGYKSTKSGDDRVLEIPEPLVPTLQELKIKSAGNDFVLPRLVKWDKGEQARYLRLFLQMAKLPLIRFHDLRSSWATLLLGKGVAPAKVMSMGGWKDMDTMMIYMRKAGIDIKGSTSVLNNMETHGLSDAIVLDFKSN